MTWQPLLTDTRREAALSAARDIAAALADPPPCSVIEGSRAEVLRVMNLSLGMGRAGIALAHGYLALADPDHPSHAANARRLIVESVRATSTEALSVTLYDGFPGIAWVLARLRDWNLVRVDDQSLAGIDATLAGYLENDKATYFPDLVTGVSGILIYALTRLPRPDALRILERGVRAIEAAAEETPDGITWFIPAEELPPQTREKAPRGCYNLGISHGIPGIIGALAEVHAAGVERARTRRLIEDAVAWLLAREVPGTNNFHSMAGPDVQSNLARLAWCYGSPGIPLLLLRAARLLGRDDWRETALRLAHAAAERRLEESGVIDAPFCHGTAGIAHMFNRLWQETGEARFADVARAWIDRTFALRVEGEGISGFTARPQIDEQKYAEPGIVYGAAGIAAVLAAAASDVEPRWDAMFLLSPAAGSA